MSDGERTFELTMKSKAALDAAKAVKTYLELIESGVDHKTAFLQVFCGIYYLVPPQPPRPDYFLSLSDLYGANKDALAHFSLLKEEAAANIEFLEKVLSENPAD